MHYINYITVYITISKVLWNSALHRVSTSVYLLHKIAKVSDSNDNSPPLAQ